MIGRYVKHPIKAAVLALVGAIPVACVGSYQTTAKRFAYDKVGPSFAKIAPLINRGLKPGCWFGAGGAFADFEYKGDYKTENHRADSYLTYTLEPTSAGAKPLGVFLNFFVSFSGRNSFAASVGAMKGDPPNPAVPVIAARLESDYNIFRDKGTLPCPDLA